MNEPRPARWPWLGSPWLLTATVLLACAPSLAGGWLGFDDDWLVRDNELLNRWDASVLASIFFGFDRETRLVLGAEYLPVRDVITWILRAALGLDALGVRVVMVALYAASCVLLSHWARGLGREGYLLGVWLFALHPVHAESFAWIAGLKDVLALFFVAAALLLAAERTPLRRVATVVCVALACGAKSMAVVAPALLLAADLLRGRDQDRGALAATALVCVAWAGVHAWVGGLVGMIAPPLGASLVEQVLSSAVLMSRYVGLSCLVHPQSLLYEANVHGPDANGLASLALLAALGGLAAWRWRRGERWPAALLLWFLASLAPVSQLVAPLQNRLADRYLLIAVLAPCAAAGLGIELTASRVRPSIGTALVAVALGVCGMRTAARAHLFADPVALFAEATDRTAHDPRPPLLLGDALFAAERYAEAELAFRAAIERDGLRTVPGRRAGNRLAMLLAGTGREAEARELYAELIDRYPDDPRALHNLAVLEQRAGLGDLAAQHRLELAARFPDYRPGADRPGPL